VGSTASIGPCFPPLPSTCTPYLSVPTWQAVRCGVAGNAWPLQCYLIPPRQQQLLHMQAQPHPLADKARRGQGSKA
jgi:hypothetical protein